MSTVAPEQEKLERMVISRKFAMVFAVALSVGQACAFISPAAVQRANVHTSAVCAPAPGFRRGVALRVAVQSADVARLVEAGMSAETAEKVLGEGKTVNQAMELMRMRIDATGRANGAQEIADGQAGVGARTDPVGYVYVDVEGDYVDDGYVDESMPAYRQGSGQGFFGGLFGNGQAKAAEAAKREQQRKEMDVITFVNPDATPGLMHKRPSYFDPDVVGSTKNRGSGLFKSIDAPNGKSIGGSGIGSSNTGRSDVSGAAPPPPSVAAAAMAAMKQLPAGWLTAVDEASGMEYYYNAAGDVTWERPQ